MSGGSRALPDRPNLRYLRLEAERRPAVREYGLEGTASLAIRSRDHRTHVVLTSRLIPVNSIDAALLRAWTNPTNPN